MSEHTKEPWFVGETTHEDGEFIETAIMALEGEAAPAVCLDFGFNNLGMRDANATRIVLCVNVCAGIENKYLEDALKKGGLVTPRQAIEVITKQRDELLDAFNNMATTIERQLELITERAKGDFLDKRAMVQAMQLHLKRAKEAIAKAEATS